MLQYTERLLLEEEHGGHIGLEATCFAMSESRQNKSPCEPDWKQNLKREIMSDVKDQMKELAQEVMNEIKPLLQQTGLADTPSHIQPRFEQRRSIYFNSWTKDGKPICQHCRQAGHIATFCQSSSGSQTALN